MRSVDDAEIFQVMHGVSKGKSLIRIRCKCGGASDGQGVKTQPGRVVRMFEAKGWEVDPDGLHATCPRCLKMKKLSESGGVPSPHARRMRRAAYRLLEEKFDEDTGRYAAGWSDAAIAAEVKLSESAIADIRNKEFALLALDPDLERIREKVEDVESRWTTEKARLVEELKALDKETGEALAGLKIDLMAALKGFQPAGATA